MTDISHHAEMASTRPHLDLFSIGKRLHAERQQFVDFCAVEQITGAFRRDPGIVGQDDRRGQHGVVLVFGFVAYANRPGADATTTFRQLDAIRIRIQQ